MTYRWPVGRHTMAHLTFTSRETALSPRRHSLSPKETMAVVADLARVLYMKVGNRRWPPSSTFKRRYGSLVTRQPSLRIRCSHILPSLLSHKPCLLTDYPPLCRNPTPASVCKVLSFSLGNHTIRRQHTKDLPSRMCRCSQHPLPYQDQFIMGVVLTLAEVPNASTTVQRDHTHRVHLYSVSFFTSD